jgi:signal-transduction protein with cAMP-binding, CBS, and nucleotidyltransferase domain
MPASSSASASFPSLPSALSTSGSPRRRVSTRRVSFEVDEHTSSSAQAIRKKIESELSRKRTISTTHQQGRKQRSKPNVQKGTVAALKPSPALTVPESITVSEASQLCAAKRTDCVLVVDDDEGLSGIFTAKDLAYRVSKSSMTRSCWYVDIV